MSQEDVEIVRRSFDAWNEGDVRAIRGFYTDDVVLQTPITEFQTPITEFGRTFEGDDPIGRWIAEMRETWAEVHWDVEHTLEGNGVVVSFYRSISIGRNSGAEVVRDLTGISRICDGLIASETVHRDREEALKAAGLWEWARSGPARPEPSSTPCAQEVQAPVTPGGGRSLLRSYAR